MNGKVQIQFLNRYGNKIIDFKVVTIPQATMFYRNKIVEGDCKLKMCGSYADGTLIMRYLTTEE